MIKKIQKELEKYSFETVDDTSSVFRFRTVNAQGVVTVRFDLLPPAGMKICVVTSLPEGQVGCLGSTLVVHVESDAAVLARAISGRSSYAMGCLDAFVAGLPG